MRGRCRGAAARRVVGLAALLAALALASCAQGSGTDGAYGGALNHIHDLLALAGMPSTVLLATHIGLYRSTDAGRAWTDVAGGSGQPMDGLMLFKLAQSPVDPRRVYVLAIPRTGRPQDAKATPGIYTSDDAGRTWRMATAESALPSGTIFTVGVGSGAAGQLYTWVPALAAKGLYASDDYGAHWRQLPQLPDAHLTGVMGDPNKPGRLIFWSTSTGLYTSNDGGTTWNQATGTQDGIFSVAVAGQTIYASGGDGVFVSTDDGATFSLTDKADTFSAIVASAKDPGHAYALAGTAVYATRDGGHTWAPTAPTSSHPGNLTADPQDAANAYVGFSYPVGVEATTDDGAHWRPVLP